jgi:hypothetical protein
MNNIRQVAVFAWSLRSINQEIMAHARPGPKPDGADAVGDFEKPDSTHRKRAREWEEAIERGADPEGADTDDADKHRAKAAKRQS